MPLSFYDWMQMKYQRKQTCDGHLRWKCNRFGDLACDMYRDRASFPVETCSSEVVLLYLYGAGACPAATETAQDALKKYRKYRRKEAEVNER